MMLLTEKKMKHWLENKKTKELIEFIALAGIPTDDLIKEHKPTNELRGTYIHKKLILSLAMWISTDVYMKVSTIIKQFVVREHQESIRIMCRLVRLFVGW